MFGGVYDGLLKQNITQEEDSLQKSFELHIHDRSLMLRLCSFGTCLPAEWLSHTMLQPWSFDSVPFASASHVEWATSGSVHE
jgi:hypothetical protein